MAELYPDDATLTALSGLADAEQGVLYPPIGESPYYTSFYRMLYRLLDVARRAGDLRVYPDAAMTCGVRAGRFATANGTEVTFAGAAAVALADNATNYLALLADGTLSVTQDGWPDAASAPHVPLATIVTAGGTYGPADVTDCRGWALYRTVEAPLPASGPVVRGYPVTPERLLNANGTPLSSTGGAGQFFIEGGGWGLGWLRVNGSYTVGNTSVETLLFEAVLPPEYVAGEPIGLAVVARVGGSGTPGTCTLAVICCAVANDGTVLADRCTTAPQALAATAEHSFTLDPTGLAAGDRLRLFAQTSVQETSASGVLYSQLDAIRLTLTVKE